MTGGDIIHLWACSAFCFQEKRRLSPTLLWFGLQVTVGEEKLQKCPGNCSGKFITFDHMVVVKVMQSTSHRKSDNFLNQNATHFEWWWSTSWQRLSAGTLPLLQIKLCFRCFTWCMNLIHLFGVSTHHQYGDERKPSGRQWEKMVRDGFWLIFF